VREIVSKHPDIMKYETRHAKDDDYKADVMVGASRRTATELSSSSSSSSAVEVLCVGRHKRACN
jgi:hypothetical protein